MSGDENFPEEKVSSMTQYNCCSIKSTFQTFSKVVIASVAILLFTSVIKFSRSRLQTITDWGCIMATLFKVRTAANRRVGLGELKKS